jgi:hypothetical protein
VFLQALAEARPSAMAGLMRQQQLLMLQCVRACKSVVGSISADAAREGWDLVRSLVLPLLRASNQTQC